MAPLNKILAFICLLVLAACSKAGDTAPTPTPAPAPTPTVSAPTAATLSLPEKNKTCESGVSVSATQSDLTFTWAAGANTETYELQVINLNTNESRTFSDIKTPSLKVTLNKATPYSWKVTSKSSKIATTATSETWNFYLAGTAIVNYAPFPAEILTPTASIFATITNGKVTISWKGSDPEADALTYTLYVDQVDGKQTPDAKLTNITATSVDYSVETGKIYYFRVKTFDGKNSSYSVVYQFRT